MRLESVIRVSLLALALAGCAAAPERAGLPPVEDRSLPTAAGSGSAPSASVPHEGETAAVETAPLEVETLPAEPYRAPALPPATSTPAVRTLLARADEAGGRGDWAAAAAALERALRIEPANARLWHRLAMVRLEQGRYEQAAQLAVRSNSYAAGDVELIRANWFLIADARRAQSDEAGARAAERKAASYE